MNTLRAAATLAALLALAACSGDAGPLGGEPAEGVAVVSFSYSGPLQGSWRAEGRLDISRADETTWASGLVRSGRTDVQATYQRADGMQDWVVLELDRATPGEVVLDDCQGPDCPGLMVAFGLRDEHGSQAAYSCSLQEGTLRLAEVTSGRARGTFAGSGVCIPEDGDLLEGFVVTGGSFDVPLR